jgi:hypothetical protein
VTGGEGVGLWVMSESLMTWGGGRLGEVDM